MDGEDQLLLLLDFADRRSRAARPLAFRSWTPSPTGSPRKKEEYRINQETIGPLILGPRPDRPGRCPPAANGGQLKKLYDLQLDGAFSTSEQGLALFRKEQKKAGALKK